MAWKIKNRNAAEISEVINRNVEIAPNLSTELKTEMQE